jgi:hypothetical protein
MATRDRITLAIALVVVSVAVISSYFPLVAIPLWLSAAFLFVWGREPRRTNAFIGRLPGGGYILKALAQLDCVLSPRAQDYDQQAIVTDNTEQTPSSGLAPPGPAVVDAAHEAGRQARYETAHAEGYEHGYKKGYDEGFRIGLESKTPPEPPRPPEPQSN